MEINKLMRFLIPPLLAVSLAGCARAEVPQMFTSPVFICHDPDITPNTPFQIVMVQVIVDKNQPSLILQSFAGSPSFAPNADGSLNPFTMGKVTHVKTGVDAIIDINGQPVNIGGCLVDKNDQRPLQDFFNLHIPKERLPIGFNNNGRFQLQKILLRVKRWPSLPNPSALDFNK